VNNIFKKRPVHQSKAKSFAAGCDVIIIILLE
jgi:hypothetical protein